VPDSPSLAWLLFGFRSSKGNIIFQPFFMLMTNHPSFFVRLSELRFEV
jgi:hypothetical protein